MLTTKERIMAICRTAFGDEIHDRAANGEAIFATHGGDWTKKDLDSLDRVEFCMAVEDEFKVDIPDSIMGGFSTVDEVLNYVETMLSPPAHGAR